MKVIKKTAPILLIITIVLCLLFCFLVILNVPILKWHIEDCLKKWMEITGYYNIFDYPSALSQSSPLEIALSSTALQNGTLSFLSFILERFIPLGNNSFISSFFDIITKSLIPVSIAVISVIILALYIAFVKTKTSLYSKGVFAIILKVFSFIALAIEILSSLFILVASLPTLLLRIIKLIEALFSTNSIVYWSYLTFTAVNLLLSITNVLVFFLIFITLILFLVITIKSDKRKKLPQRKALVSLLILSLIGAVVSTLVSVHFILSQGFYFIRVIAQLIEYGASMQDIFSFIINLLTMTILMFLVLSISIGFIITLVKVIISLKKSSKKELYAYNSEELAYFDSIEVPEYDENNEEATETNL